MHFRLKVFAFAASLALATAAHAQTSPLDPENFLDPQLEETFALIATDLANCGIAPFSGEEIGTTALLPPQESGPAQTDVTSSAALAIEVQEPAQAVEPSAPEVATASEAENPPPAEEITGALAAEVGAPTLAITPGDDIGTPVEPSLAETSRTPESADEFEASLLP